MLINEMVDPAELRQLIATAMEYGREEGLLPAQPDPRAEEAAVAGLQEEIGHIETARMLIPMVVAQHVRGALREIGARAARSRVAQTERLFHNLLTNVAPAGRAALLKALATLDPREQRDVQQSLMRKFDDLRSQERRRFPFPGR